MTRLGSMYGPDATFLGVPRADLAEQASYAEADVVIVGAPFDGGTSHRPGARFGPAWHGPPALGGLAVDVRKWAGWQRPL